MRGRPTRRPAERVGLRLRRWVTWRSGTAQALVRLSGAVGPRTWRWSLVALVLLAALLRLVGLEHAPLPVNQDELSNAYDAWCLAETGCDRWGRPHPVLLRGFGDLDFRPALQAWLTVLPMKLAGFSVGGARAVSGAVGTLTVLLVALGARPLLGPGGALLAALVAVLSPWHLLYSRMAHEGGALPPFFVALVLVIWHRARGRRYAPAAMLWLGFALGAATNAYQASRFFALGASVLVACELALWVRRRPARWRRGATGLGALVVSAALTASPQLWAAATEPEHFFARARERLLPASGVADLAAQVAHNLAANLGPRYLFFSSGEYNNLSMGRALPVEAPFFYLGLVGIWWWLPSVRRRRWARIAMLLVLCLLPAALTDTQPHALRASGASVLVGLYSCLAWLAVAAGAWVCGAAVDGRAWRRRALAWLGAGAAAVVACGSLLGTAYWRSERLRDEGHQHLLVRTGQWLGRHARGFERVFVDPAGIQPYLYVAAFGGMTPREFQAAPKEVDTIGWDEVLQVGRFHFIRLDRALATWREAGQPPWLAATRDARPQHCRELGQVEQGDHRVVFSVFGPELRPPGAVPLADLPLVPVDCEFAPPAVNAAFNGESLDLEGIRYTTGIGMHAPCRAVVRLPVGSWHLRALAGVGGSARGCREALVELRVLGADGRVLASSGPLAVGSAAWRVEVDLRGQREVTLDVQDGGNGRDCDHVVWADALLVPAG